MLKMILCFFRSRNGDAFLRHYHYDFFELFPIDKKDGVDTTGPAQLNIQYHMNAAGDIDMMSLPIQPGLKDIEFNRIPKPKEIAKADLEKFVGEYELRPNVFANFISKEKKHCMHLLKVSQNMNWCLLKKINLN
jgi:hypothetical protein